MHFHPKIPVIVILIIVTVTVFFFFYPYIFILKPGRRKINIIRSLTGPVS
jgi:hypothetical protein